MTGRENPKENDLFFTCSLIEYIARKTKNKRSDIVNALGRASIEKIYDLADIYHSDNIERVSEDFIKSAEIKNGTFDNVSSAKYAIPSHWDIGKVYKRLIIVSHLRKLQYPFHIFSFQILLNLSIPQFLSRLPLQTPPHVLHSPELFPRTYIGWNLALPLKDWSLH